MARRTLPSTGLSAAAAALAPPNAAPPFHTAPHTSGEAMEIRQIPTAAIVASPLNPRRTFDDRGIEELANNIRIFGLEQPITVRPTTVEKDAEASPQTFEIVMGERRWRACSRIGLESIACRVIQCSDAELVQRALGENLQRQELDPYSEAWGLAKAMELDPAITQEQLGGRFGMTQASVSRMLGLLRLPESVAVLLRSGALSKSSGFALVPLVGIDLEACAALADLAVKDGLTTDALIQKVKEAIQAAEQRNQPSLPMEAATPAVAPGETVTTTTRASESTTVRHEGAPAAQRATSPATTPPSGIKEGYTQEQAKAEFEASQKPDKDITSPVKDAIAAAAARPPAAPAPSAPTPDPTGRVATSIRPEDDDWLWDEGITLDQALERSRMVRGDSVRLLKALTDHYNSSREEPITPGERLLAILAVRAEDARLDVATILSNPE